VTATLERIQPEHRDRVPAWVPALLRERGFRRYWTGHTVSLFGDQVSILAVPLLAVLTAHANAAQMGYLTAAGLLPYLLFSLVTGVWADRSGHRRLIMIGADAGRALVLVAVPVLGVAGLLTLPVLYGVTFTVGTLSVLFEVCDNTVFAALVPPDRYVEANTLLNGSRAMSLVGGPSAVGVLVQVLGAPLALLADAGSYLVSALMLTRIRPVEPPPARRDTGGIGSGLRLIGQRPVLWTMLAATTTLNLFNYIFSALFVLYATRALGLAPGTLGLVLGCGAVGALAGAGVTGRLVRRLGIGPAYVVGQLLFPLPTLLVPLAGGPRPVVLAMLVASEFLSGAGVMLLDITAGSLMTAATPDHMRARMSGAHRTVNYGIRPVGAVLGGALGTAFGVHTTLWIGGAGSVLGAIWLLAGPIPRMRTL
jgi:MFS family permease